MNIQIVDIIIRLFATHGEKIRFNIDAFEQTLNDHAKTMLNECFIMIEGMRKGIYDTLIFDDLRDYSVYMNILTSEMNFTLEESIFMLKCYERIIKKMDYSFEVGDIERLCVSAIDSNNIPILCALSNAYYKGFGVKQDYQKALEIMTYLSNQDIHLFDAKIGYMYEYGYGTQEDLNMALYYYGSDNSECHYMMGTLYMSGKYVEKNYDEAISHFEKSTETKAYYYLGVLYEYKKRYADSFMAYDQGMKLLDADCFYRAGLLQSKGKGVIKDEKNAKHYFKCGYYCFHNKSAYELGVMKINKCQYEKGVYYLKHASNLGSKDASLLLAKYYETGTYVKKDLQKSSIYYRKALEIKL